MDHCITWNRLEFMREMLSLGYSVIWADALYMIDGDEQEPTP